MPSEVSEQLKAGTAERVYNFRPGPAMLPLAVLEQVHRELLVFPGVGMSALELNHRSATFDAILEGAEADIRRLADIPDNYRVLFLGAAASLQFAMVPMNLLAAGSTADYVVTGLWAQRALDEGRKIGAVHVAASTDGELPARVPRQDELHVTPGAAYLHITANNTDVGTQWKALPEMDGVPLVSDSTSDMFSGPLDVSRFGVIYAGAQKNLGPSGMTLVIIREDLLQRSASSVPTMLSYSVHAAHRSIYNTPPVFSAYVLRLMVKWLLDQGGLAAIGRRNERKAAALYAEIDRTGFYRGMAAPGDRSLMNVTFRLPSEALDARFVREAAAHALDGLEGHQTLGGMRASIYNAFPEEGVEALVQFMREFERTHG